MEKIRDTKDTEGEFLKNFDDDDNLLQDNRNKTTKKCAIISIISIIFVILIIIIILIFTVFNKKDKEEDKEEDNYDDPYEIDIITSEEMNKARNSFKQLNFNYDELNPSKIIFYNLFIPDNCNSNIKYPLIVFIAADEDTVGREITVPLTETVGGPIWATDTIQKRYKCFVLVPQYNEIIIDNKEVHSKGEYINATIKLISELLNKYNIDSNKIYGTGQSMGAIATLYILANYPNLYTASLIVSGQWNIDRLQGLINSTFTYLVAGGDIEAFNGQNQFKDYLNSKNISYGTLSNINAQEKIELLNNFTNNMFYLKYQHNFITYSNGSVIIPNSKIESEHKASYKYGYRIDAVREWLLEQNKVKCPEGLYYSEDGKCSETNFCSLSRNDYSCRNCIDEYYLSVNNICTNDINCHHGVEKTGLCISCTYDYYLDIQDRKCKIKS